MNTGIKNFLLPLVCAVGVLTALTPFSDVHARIADDSHYYKEGYGKREANIATQVFCGRGARDWVQYHNQSEGFREDFLNDTIDSKEYGKKKLNLYNSAKEILGYSIFEIPKLCFTDWNL